MNHLEFWERLEFRLPADEMGPTCNNREASGMAYGEYEDDFWSNARSLGTFFQKQAWRWASTKAT